MKSRDPLRAVAAKVEAAFGRHKVQLTLGGEPTYVPLDPLGAEWSITALGPTKLRYAAALADALISQELPHALAIYSPGKTYPGEMNPRWAIHLLWRRNGMPLWPGSKSSRPMSRAAIELFKKRLLGGLRVKARWLRGIDPLDKSRPVWILPLDHDGRRFVSQDWALGGRVELLRAEGAAGLRLPLDSLPAEASRRALTFEVREEDMHVFVPPLLQTAFLQLLAGLARAAGQAGCGPLSFSGYIPPDDTGCWRTLVIAADPGVLEINLPPCGSCAEYARWMTTLERATASAGLCSFKQLSPGEQGGTGGGNHLLFGGPSLETNPFFTRPRWLSSILRYWQHHPSLSYLFTGVYVGASSQAPRPDESITALYDLEMAYQFIEQLPPGDHRHLMGETLRHLHTDASGNTHRSEISFDKFWNTAFDGGCRGLIEFRALESLPRADWMSAIAVLWRALAALLLDKPFTKPLVDHRRRLHDSYFLPSVLWGDFEKVLRDLRRAGFSLPAAPYRQIAEWRFPVLLEHRHGAARLTVRRAHEDWPLLCETPLEGGQTSRFVDTSIARLELLANAAFALNCTLFVQGRKLILEPFSRGKFGLGLRYRRSALYPSLHPGIRPHMPLVLEIRQGRERWIYELMGDRGAFQKTDAKRASFQGKNRPVRKLEPELVTFDLRLP